MKRSRSNLVKYKYVLKLSYSIILANLSYVLFGFTDALMLGHLGAEAIAAIGISLSLIWLVQVPILEGFMDNSIILFSQAFGAKNIVKLKDLLIHELVLAFLIGIISILVYFPLTVLIHYMTNSIHVFKMSQVYTLTIISGFPIYAIGSISMRFLLATNNNKVISFFSISSVFINIGLNYLLIFGKLGLPKLGIQGSAIGSLISKSIESIGFLIVSIYVLLKILRKNNSKFKIKCNIKIIENAFEIGIPLAMTSFVESAAWTSFTAIVSRLGTISMAAQEASMRIKDVSYVPGTAIGNVTTSIVGQNIGKSDYDNARQYCYISLKLAVCITSFFSVILLVFSEPIIKLIINDSEVIKLGKNLLRFLAVYQIIDTIYNIFKSSLRGMGDVKYVRNMTFFVAWFVWIPLSILFAYIFHWGLIGAWIALGVFVITLTGIYGFRFSKTNWVIKSKVVS